ncbi:MAG: diacylglycerol/lipid kinase family protein [Candidatus Hodarchaeota archaeon]
MHIYLNPHCDYGQGRSKWQKIEPELRLRFGEFIVEEIPSPEGLGDQIKEAIAAGEHVFIAAGGDGTVNLMVNALMNSSAAKQRVVLGAIGLGSSNDFHKTFRPETFIEGVPTRMDWKKATPCDVIRAQYRNAQNHLSTRYCIINASIGITAHANAVYNSRLPFIEFIQRISIEAAIIASALKTIFTFHNIPCKIALQKSEPHQFRLTNLGVIKNPHFAGGLCYDTPVKPDDGKLGVNLCADMTMFEAISTLVRLYKRQFRGRLKTYTWLTTTLSVTSARPLALEMDGEVLQTSHVEFKIIPKAIRCCP